MISRETRARLASLADSTRFRTARRSSLAAILLRLQAADPTASTTVRAPEAAVERHVADSLSALVLDAFAPRGGSPTWAPAPGGRDSQWPRPCPEAEVALVESAIRRCRYLERAAEEAALGERRRRARPRRGWPDGSGAHDLVTARALATLPVLCEYAAPLLARGRQPGGLEGRGRGRRSWPTDVPPRRSSASSPPSRCMWCPYAGARDHTLHVFRKIAPTPQRFPRRPGMATKRPLSAKTSSRD